MSVCCNVGSGVCHPGDVVDVERQSGNGGFNVVPGSLQKRQWWSSSESNSECTKVY